MSSRVRRTSRRGAFSRAAAADSPWRGRTPQHFVFYILIGFLLACLLGGGSNRTDVYSLLYLRPVTTICLFAMLMVPTSWDFRLVRAPLLLLAGLACLILVQLVPLPPSIWLHLPARAQFADAAIGLGGQQPWRPISLTPDRTLNSFLALFVPLTVLVGFAGIRSDQRALFIPLAIGAAVVSAMLGVVQFAGGGSNLYARNSGDVPSGLFSNRNHQAAFLDCGLILIATWLRLRPGRMRFAVRMSIGGCAALLMFVVVIATGSRTGSLLALLACAYAAITLKTAFVNTSAKRWQRLLPQAATLGVLLILAGVMTFAGRAVSIDRLIGFDAESEQRVRAIPTLITMWRELMPIGSGFGSFDPAFRVFEPDNMLHPAYFNHAHNDWLELGLDGGVPALLLLAALTIWALVRLIGSVRASATESVWRARAGGMILLILGAASITDYPIRTPLLSAFLALGCAMLGRSQYQQGGSRGSGQDTPQLQ